VADRVIPAEFQRGLHGGEMDGKKRGRNEWVDVIVGGIFRKGEEHTSINPTERIRHFAIALRRFVSSR